MNHARASFTNDVYEETGYGSADGTELVRIHIERTYTGDLEASSTAELLTATTPSGSAGYVAHDAITGRLAGREGTFVFQHGGTISNEGSHVAGLIVPGSGSGELEGLHGRGDISVDEDGTHHLALDYELG
jgi:hypothetical protein